MYGGLDLEDYRRGGEGDKREESPTSHRNQPSKMTAGRRVIMRGINNLNILMISKLA